MNGFAFNLLARSRGTADVIRPRVASLFEPGESAADASATRARGGDPDRARAASAEWADDDPLSTHGRESSRAASSTAQPQGPASMRMPSGLDLDIEVDATRRPPRLRPTHAALGESSPASLALADASASANASADADADANTSASASASARARLSRTRGDTASPTSDGTAAAAAAAAAALLDGSTYGARLADHALMTDAWNDALAHERDARNAARSRTRAEARRLLHPQAPSAISADVSGSASARRGSADGSEDADGSEPHALAAASANAAFAPVSARVGAPSSRFRFEQAASRPQPADAEPVVHVSIGRIDVRAIVERASDRKASAASPVMSLDDYLKVRARGGSR